MLGKRVTFRSNGFRIPVGDYAGEITAVREYDLCKIATVRLDTSDVAYVCVAERKKKSAEWRPNP